MRVRRCSDDGGITGAIPQIYTGFTSATRTCLLHPAVGQRVGPLLFFYRPRIRLSGLLACGGQRLLALGFYFCGLLAMEQAVPGIERARIEAWFARAHAAGFPLARDGRWQTLRAPVFNFSS